MKTLIVRPRRARDARLRCRHAARPTSRSRTPGCGLRAPALRPPRVYVDITTDVPLKLVGAHDVRGEIGRASCSSTRTRTARRRDHPVKEVELPGRPGDALRVQRQPPRAARHRRGRCSQARNVPLTLEFAEANGARQYDRDRRARARRPAAARARAGTDVGGAEVAHVFAVDDSISYVISAVLREHQRRRAVLVLRQLDRALDLTSRRVRARPPCSADGSS